MTEHPRLSASVALAAFAEPVVTGARVLVVGEATSPLVERLLERGARLVHVVDVDPSRVAEAAAHNTEPHVSFAPLGPAGLPIRDGAFDVAIVENLSLLPDLEVVLRQIRRALGARGAALLASPNPDATAHLLPRTEGGTPLDYYALYDRLSAAFEQVRMFGQAPFVGYAVVDFAPESDPEPAFDADFVPGGAEEPEWFIAVVTQVDASLEAFTVVQLPAIDVLGARAAASLEQQLRGARAAERQARDRMGVLEAELAARDPQASEPHAEVIARLEVELARREQWVQKLEDRASTADARADAVQAELDAAEEALAATQRDLTALTADLRAERQRRPSEAASMAKAVEESAAAKATEAKSAADARAALKAAEALAATEARAASEAKGVAKAATAKAAAEAQAAAEAKAAVKAATAKAAAEAQAAAEAKAAAKAATAKAAAEAASAAEAKAALARAIADLAAAKERTARATAELEHARQKPAQDTALRAELATIEQQAAADVAALEAQLAGRGHEVQALEASLREAARAGAELLRDNERLRLDAGTDALAAQVTELSRQNAGLTVDLQAAHWRLAATGAAVPTDPTAPSEPSLDASAGELRVALSEARARIHELNVLLEQVRAVPALRSGPASPEATPTER